MHKTARAEMKVQGQNSAEFWHGTFRQTGDERCPTAAWQPVFNRMIEPRYLHQFMHKPLLGQQGGLHSAFSKRMKAIFGF
jgi:hypothetical protein